MKRKKFKKYELEIDASNVDELKKFFKEHEDYEAHEIACKYEIPVRTVRYWRDKAGIKSNKQKLSKLKTRFKAKQFDKVTDPEIWDNHDWLHEHYVEKRYGTIIISRITGVSNVTIWRRLIKYNIPVRSSEESVKSKNVHCNYEWLYEHYIEKRMPRYKIAKMIGVSDYTISNWLSKFGILPRTMDEAMVVSKIDKKIKKKWNKQQEN